MLAIDGPIAVLSGLVLADAGKGLLKGGGKRGTNFMRRTVLLFAVFFITPVPFYFFMGWPAWETNYLWQWPDSLLDSPLRAFASFAIFAFTVAPAYLGFELGRWLVLRGKDVWVRVGYVGMVLLVGAIVLLTRDITFNVASTYAKYQAGEFYSFWSQPFFTGWLIVTVYFWGSLAAFYIWLRKRSASQPQ